MRALTAASGTDGDSEVLACLTTLVNSSVNTGLLHESFDVNNASSYTRPWCVITAASLFLEF
jgi:meiotically up-regulated gene 157 (Mug157) protein